MVGRQSLIALGVAVILGLLAVFLTNTYLTSSQQRQDAQGTVKVAVAAVPLSYGVDITREKIRFIDYPKSSMPPGSFTNAAQLLVDGKKRVALLPISVNEPILANKISGVGQGASIAALLPDGMRAATVRINDVSGVAGFIQPTDSVDVLITRQLPQGQATDVLLQNVQVIAIDQQSRNPDGSPNVGRSATLQVTPIDSQKLALAQEVGNLSLVLRKPGEANNPVVETISMNDLRYNMYGGARYPAPAVVGGYQAPAPTRVVVSTPRPRPVVRRAPARPSGTTVEIVRGTQGNEYKVGGNGR